MIDPNFFSQTINSYLPEPQASLLKGIIFGLPLRSKTQFYQQLKIVGLLHLVVLSGINITLLGSIVAGFTRNFSKWISILITILIIIFFIWFVKPQAPVIRAGFMGIITLVSFISGRKSVGFYSLFLSFIFISIFWPSWVRTLSFQLSYAATAGLLIFGQYDDIRTDNFVKKIFFYAWNEFKTSVSAQVFTAPLIFFHFKQISLISPLSNILISFLIAPLMLFGFLTALLGKIDWYFGYLPATICLGLLTYMVWVIENLASLPHIFIDFNR